MVEVGAQKDRAMDDGATPLIIAAAQGHSDIVHHLVEVGADKDWRTKAGKTALFFAAYNGHLDIVRHLLEVGANKDQARNDGATPFLVAALQGHHDVVDLLGVASATGLDLAQHGHGEAVPWQSSGLNGPQEQKDSDTSLAS